jgi:rhomboid protease GluP
MVAPPPRRPIPLPQVTVALIAINVLVYVLMVVSGVSALNPSIQQLLNWGAAYGPLSLGPEPWRLLTATFVHGGLLHIGVNMWCLWNLGPLAERIFGRVSYLTLYLICGLAGSVASLWWHPMVVGVGASGAIFGVAGALITALFLGKLPLPKAAMRGTLQSLVIFAVLNLGIGQVAGGIDNSAHIGGLAAGLVLGAGLAPTLTQPSEERGKWRVTVFLVLLGALVVATYYLRGKNVTLF